MFRVKSAIKLGRWSTEKTFEECMRAVDLANYDSHGSKEPEPFPRYRICNDDVIDFGVINIGSFDVHGIPSKN